MNKRTVSIIYELSNLDKVVTIESLSNQFSVSSRTIRNDLNAINELLEENNYPLIELKGGPSGRR